MTHPATATAHWVTGPVYCCAKHCDQLVKVGAALGVVVAVTHAAPEGAQCKNCENEADMAVDAEREAAHIKALP